MSDGNCGVRVPSPWFDFWLACTKHARAVLEFMIRANQLGQRPEQADVPPESTRLLRGKLVIEEALELLDGLGLTLTLSDRGEPQLTASHEPDLVAILDGCADLRVVTTGTLLACHVPDDELQALVDASNLAKFKPGHSFRADGKLIKPADWQAPDLLSLLQRLGAKLGPVKCVGEEK